MTQERINLTQFEGHEKKVRLDEHGKNLHIVVPPNKPVGPWNAWKGGLLFDLGEQDAMGDSCVPTARLMAASPDLIVELKRMYKREDELMEILSILEDRHDIDMSQFDASE
jgi:hypothetical protein